LIAAELVFGVASSQGGLGWFIFRNRNELFTDKVFAGLAAVILIGLLAVKCWVCSGDWGGTRARSALKEGCNNRLLAIVLISNVNYITIQTVYVQNI